MSLPKPDLHIRVSADCKALLGLLAEVEQVPVSTLAEHILLLKQAFDHLPDLQGKSV